jgi:hypothetical protein
MDGANGKIGGRSLMNSACPVLLASQISYRLKDTPFHAAVLRPGGPVYAILSFHARSSLNRCNILQSHTDTLLTNEMRHQ